MLEFQHLQRDTLILKFGFGNDAPGHSWSKFVYGVLAYVSHVHIDLHAKFEFPILNFLVQLLKFIGLLSNI